MKPEITIMPTKPELLKSLNEKPESFDWLGLMAGITHLHVAGHDVIEIVDSALKGAEGVNETCRSISGHLSNLADNPTGLIAGPERQDEAGLIDSQTLPGASVESGEKGVERVSAPERLEEK